VTDINTTAGRHTGACIICHRDDPTSGIACHTCRHRIGLQLGELTELYTLLPEEIMPGAGRRDPHVTGTPGKTLGVNITALDLLLPVPSRLASRLADTVADPFRDQTGPLPVVVWLDQWVRAWIDVAGVPGRLPTPSVTRLAGWLARSVHGAADHPDSMIDDFAAELREQLAMLRRVTHMQPVRLMAECTKCDRRALTRWPLSKYVECGRCGVLFKPGEYDQFLTTQVKATLNTQEAS
jgi:ribosomal protein L37AE/L43A